MLKFSMMLQAVDRVSGPAKRIMASVKGMTRGVDQFGKKAKAIGSPTIGLKDRVSAPAKRITSALAGVERQAKQTDRAFNLGFATGRVIRLAASNVRLKESFAAAGRAGKHWAGKAGIGSWGDAAEKAGRGVGALTRKLGGMALTGAKWAAGGAAAAGSFALFDLFGVASKFEQYQIMLANMEGSNAAAKKSFNWVKDFAQTTPYELDDVMNSFVKLKAYGIDPMDGSLRAMGDAAAGMSKPLEAAVEAVADAMQGENERLKEFGITASVAGDQVTYTYRKAGKELTVVTKKGLAAKQALTGIFNDRFGGMMAKQSMTLSGMISNLKDSWSNFLMMVADAGIFDLVKGKVSGVLARVNELAKSGKLKAWAQQISDQLEKAFKWGEDFVNKTDWNAVIADLKAVGNAAVIVANAVATIAANWGRVSAAVKFATPTLQVPQMLMGFATQPKASETAKPGASPRAAAPVPLAAWPKLPAPSVRFPFKAPVAPRPSLAAPRVSSLQLAPPRLSGNRLASASPSAPAAATQVGGEVRVILESRDGTRARVASVSSANRMVPIQVATGRTMAGAA